MPCRRAVDEIAPRRLHTFQNDLELLVVRPAATSAGFNNYQPFNLSTVLIAVHRDCYTAITLSRARGEQNSRGCRGGVGIGWIARKGRKCAITSHGNCCRAYTPKEKARISAGALTSVVIVGWLVVLECRELHAGG